MSAHLCEGPALAFQPALGWEGHTGPRGGAVEHGPAVGFTNSTTGEGGQRISQNAVLKSLLPKGLKG